MTSYTKPIGIYGSIVPHDLIYQPIGICGSIVLHDLVYQTHKNSLRIMAVYYYMTSYTKPIGIYGSIVYIPELPSVAPFKGFRTINRTTIHNKPDKRNSKWGSSHIYHTTKIGIWNFAAPPESWGPHRAVSGAAPPSAKPTRRSHPWLGSWVLHKAQLVA